MLSPQGLSIPPRSGETLRSSGSAPSGWPSGGFENALCFRISLAGEEARVGKIVKNDGAEQYG
jgi:hypothetical protein